MAAKKFLNNHMTLVYKALECFENNLKVGEEFDDEDTENYLKNNHPGFFSNKAITHLTKYCNYEWHKDYKKETEKRKNERKDPVKIPENVSDENFIWYILEKEKIDFKLDFNIIASLLYMTYPKFTEKLNNSFLIYEIQQWQQFKKTKEKHDYAVQKNLLEIKKPPPPPN